MMVEPMPVLAGLVLGALFVASLVNAAVRDENYGLLWYRSRYIWMCVTGVRVIAISYYWLCSYLSCSIFSMLVVQVCFGVGVSGSLYCVIRSTPLVGYAADGEIQIFSGGNRDQFLLEGVIVAFWTLAVACGCVGMMKSATLPSSAMRHVGVIVSLSIIIVFLTEICDLYGDKTEWYHVKDTYPSYAWSWLSVVSGPVKKQSRLWKRLLRVSELFLFDFRNWPSFKQRFQILLVDYLMRLWGELKETVHS